MLEASFEAKTREAEPFLPPPLRKVPQAFERSVAVMLGVNAYRHGVPPLKTAVPDVEAVGAALEGSHGFTQVLRRNAEVTVESVRALFKGGLRDELGSVLGERDRLLVYFAGHGLTMPSDRGPEGHLLFADADPADPRSYFAMKELRRILAALPCRHVLIVLDCCFAGTFRWAGKRKEARHAGAKAFRETLDRYVKRRAFQALVSACHDQTALDTADTGRPLSPPSTRRPFDSVTPDPIDALRENRLETGRHSPFAAALLRGLRGEADFNQDNLVTAAELELFVRDEVERATRVHQTPQLYKLDEHDRGEFVFQVPGKTLELEPSPAISLVACPYQGLQSYGAPQRERFFGRARATAALVDRVKAHPFTALIGPSGSGKSSLLAAGLAPVLRDAQGWTVLEDRPGRAPDQTLRDLIKVLTEGGIDPGTTLFERITAWLSAHPSGRLCLAVDQAEEFETLASAEARNCTFDDLKLALDAHGSRLRIVFALRSEFDPLFRTSALASFWSAGVFSMPALASSEVREIIERPAGAHELSFEPPALIDALTDEIMQAPGALPLLSFALRELYVCCAKRNRDRMLLEADYVTMGRLSGALATHASGLLGRLRAEDPAYEATARRVFLRMVVKHGDEWLRRRVKRDDLTYADEAENRRVGRLLEAFGEARLLVSDKDECEPAHDELVRSWPALAAWRAKFGLEALSLQLDLAEAARRWSTKKKNPAYLWHNDERLRAAEQAARQPDTWLNAREQEFVRQSLARRRAPLYLLAYATVMLALGSLGVGYTYYWPHVSYYQNYVRYWDVPKGVGSLGAHEAMQRSSKVQFVRKGSLGKVERVALMGDNHQLAYSDKKGLGSGPELDIGQKAGGERMPCQWHFDYDTSGELSGEMAQDRADRLVYTLFYRPSLREQKRNQFFDPIRNVIALRMGGNAEPADFMQSTQGYDIEKCDSTSRSRPAREQDVVSMALLQYDERQHLTGYSFLDKTGKPVRGKDGCSGWRATFDDRGNERETAFFDETYQPCMTKRGVASIRWTYNNLDEVVKIELFNLDSKLIDGPQL
jgi:uncharacterized caspase-like protein/energy-coupling factor transporter ATP-binding protein EcfA2